MNSSKRAWKDLAAELQLPCRFEVGEPERLSFAENLAAADAILTTSLAEGFGMVFLEAWLTGRSLQGRDLPEITADFTSAGLDLSALHPTLDVPADWIDRNRLRQLMWQGYEATLAAYSLDSPSDAAAQLDAKLAGATVDFGDLEETFQADIIQKVAQDAGARRALIEANGWMATADRTTADQIAENASVVRREFSLEPSGTRLAAVYQAVLAGSPDPPIQPLAAPQAILDRFLSVDRFRLLRS